jgi:hypothetical protein
MAREVQISAFVDSTTKELLERHVRATGVKKGHLIEEALRHYLEALQSLPLDVVVRSRLVVTRASGDDVRRAIRSGRPTPALEALMRRGD